MSDDCPYCEKRVTDSMMIYGNPVKVCKDCQWIRVTGFKYVWSEK
jgi:hypothetical protein